MSSNVKVARVQKRGQITIPLEIRQKLNLEEGDLIAFIETEEGIVISPQDAESLRSLQAADLEEVFTFAERLASGQPQKHQPPGPTEGQSVVERTAGIFRRPPGDNGPIDFERARQAFIDHIAERYASQDKDSQT